MELLLFQGRTAGVSGFIFWCGTKNIAVQQKIIITDDSAAFSEGLRFYIETILGHRVTSVVSSGAELLDIYSQDNCDLLLLDIEMPGMNGMETLKKLQIRHREVAALAVTSYEEKAYLVGLVYAGFKGCIFKKNLFEDLQTAIDVVKSGKLFFPKYIKTI